MKIKKSVIFSFYLFIFLVIISFCLLQTSCKKKTGSAYQLTGNALVDGKNLVELKCAGCHELVPVGALSKAVWLNHTLPSMAQYLHISIYGGNQYYKS